eukprot:1533854-Prymnesium_polylepis.2
MLVAVLGTRRNVTTKNTGSVRCSPARRRTRFGRRSLRPTSADRQSRATSRTIKLAAARTKRRTGHNAVINKRLWSGSGGTETQL